MEHEFDLSECRDCKKTGVVKENEIGERECHECGLIQDDIAIDPGLDVRSFEGGDGADREHTGMPRSHLIHDYGLSTDIGWQNKDHAGAPLSKNYAKIMRRLRRQHQRTRIRNATERNLVMALGELQRLASRMALPHGIREEAAVIYRKAVEKKLVRGRSIEGVVAASLYAACRIRGNPRTLDEIGLHSRTGRKEIGRTFRSIVKELGIPVKPAAPEGYIPRFCSTLHLKNNVETSACELLEKAAQQQLTAGRGPTGIAAASVYLASRIEGTPRTQREVSVAAGVTEVTIRNRYKEICKALFIDPENPKMPK